MSSNNPDTITPTSHAVRTDRQPSSESSLGVSEHAAQMELPRVPGIVGALIGAVVLILLGSLFFLGWIPHTRKLDVARSDALETTGAKPLVDAISPIAAQADDVLLLPADIRPYQSTAIFARASGFLKPLPAGIDIGAAVQEGQLIAEISAPDMDAQLEQAKAAFEQAQVSSVRAQQEYALSQSTRTRYEQALKNNAVSAQDAEERRTQQSIGESAMKEAQANEAVMTAAVKRLQELQGFQKITAPFSGVLTFRGYDSGALITAGDAAGKELFRIEQSDVLRVSINVPQASATNLKLGQSAEVLVRNYPGKSFPGTVARSTGAVDQATRTMRVEIDVSNKDGVLLPGMYGQVRLSIHREHPLLKLPTSALVFSAEGMRVALVVNGRATYRPIALGRDFGVEVEVVSGLSETDLVINNPGSLAEGAEVDMRRK